MRARTWCREWHQVGTNKPWNQIRKAFDRARTAAGLPNIWFHDLRRSSITNARRRGVAESVIMRMSGHKTRNVFERYNIVNDEDLRAAVAIIVEGQAAEIAAAAADGNDLVTRGENAK
ncbi:MAG: tyrosine-type recombinase/integrase [Deltaproteobacteria bacterium]|nr:tyrosine-type recombinase/integrase [Deltaproteobacteria bacterium]